MNVVATLIRLLLQKDSLEDCSVEELQTLAHQNPYFTPIQFLLAQKFRATDESLYEDQLQKLALHFTDPLWLDYLLNGYHSQPLSELTNEPNADASTAAEQQNLLTADEASFLKSETEIAEPMTQPVQYAEANEDRVPDITDVPAPGNPELPVEETVDETTLETPRPSGEQIVEVVDDNRDEQVQQETVDTFVEEHVPDDSHEKSSEAAPLLPGVTDLEKEPEKNQLTFEPYHTVDYFASQGIKYVPDDKPTDRFGQQLKSFTEWLKTMKRLPHAEIAKITDASEQKVQQLADHSITEGEVVTETMAEVWAKQGNKEKAIETYNKLSLLNPDKSAYFASLVDQLKNS